MEKINRKKLNKALNKFKTRNICVIGDIMLDRFIFGDTERISPEAPVPVLIQKKEILMPGGAGNVANNLNELGCNVLLIGVIGNDNAGKRFLELFKNKKVDTQGVFASNDRPTIEKIRLIARNQQIVRIDREDGAAIGKRIEKMIETHLINLLPDLHCVIISDYVKGLLTPRLTKIIIRRACSYGIPIVADSKNIRISHFKNVTIITPNKKESQNITGELNVGTAGKKISKIIDSSVLVTEGPHGMSLFEKGQVKKLPALAREVYDVTGAGDTVASVLALSIASGLTLYESMYLSNLAAGVVVGKIGTATLGISELAGQLSDKSGS